MPSTLQRSTPRTASRTYTAKFLGVTAELPAFLNSGDARSSGGGCVYKNAKICSVYIHACCVRLHHIHLSVCLSVCLSVYLYTCMQAVWGCIICIYLSICLSIYLSACLSVYLYTYMQAARGCIICIYQSISIYLSICLSIYLHTCKLRDRWESLLQVLRFDIKWYVPGCIGLKIWYQMICTWTILYTRTCV